MPSTIGPARQDLWQRLLAEPALDPAQRCFGWPDTHKAFQVVLLGVTDPSETFASLGPAAATEEVYGIELVVKYHDPAAPLDQAPAVDLAAFGAADTIRDLVRANPTLGGTVRTARIASQRSQGTGRPLPNEANTQATGLLCVIEMTVACTARAR